MTFIPPTWFEGLLVQIGYCVIPIILAVCVWFVCAAKDHAFIGSVIAVLLIAFALIGGSFLWWENYEVPSVQSKVVTVQDWQPKAGIHTDNNGMMVIDNANQLMLVTTDGEAFLNEENFFFQKFETRDILNELKPNSTVNITYYGWREGFNSGFPNILSAEVIDDSHAVNKTINDYFGTKII